MSESLLKRGLFKLETVQLTMEVLQIPVQNVEVNTTMWSL